MTERYKGLNLNFKYGNKYKNLLISQGLIRPKKINTKIGWITLFELTSKGKIVLRDIGHMVNDSSEGIVHKYWKYIIAENYRKKGFDVSVKEYINGRPDIFAAENGKRIAIEIETGKSDAIGNIQRALKAGFDEVICIATNHKAEEKIRKELDSIPVDRRKIMLCNTFNICT